MEPPSLQGIEECAFDSHDAEFIDEDTVERETKHRIETPFEVLKRVHERLPEFVRALGHHLAVDPKDDLLRSDAEPFPRG